MYGGIQQQCAADAGKHRSFMHRFAAYQHTCSTAMRIQRINVRAVTAPAPLGFINEHV